MTRLSLSASMGFAVFLYGAFPASAQTLGAAQSFAVLGGSGVTFAPPPSTINGDVGVSPGTSITGFPANATITAPFAVHNNDASAIAARASTLALYNSLAGMGGAIAIGAGLNGQNLGPGIYTTGAALLTNGAPLILTGAGTGGGTFIFKAMSSITADVGSSITLVGVDPCNVFWQITSLATLNGTTFPGTVLAAAGVHLGTSASLTGRALTNAAGDVTMAGSNVVGGCALAAFPTPTPTPGVPTPTPIPVVPTPTPIPVVPTPTPIPVVPTPTPIPGVATPTPTPTPIPGVLTPTPTPTPTAAGIPTLSGWGLMTLIVLIGLVGVASIHRLTRI